MECRKAPVSRWSGLVGRVYRNAVFAFRSPNWMQINRIYMEWMPLDGCRMSDVATHHHHPFFFFFSLGYECNFGLLVFYMLIEIVAERSVWRLLRTIPTQTLMFFFFLYFRVYGMSTRHKYIRSFDIIISSLFVTHPRHCIDTRIKFPIKFILQANWYGEWEWMAILSVAEAEATSEWTSLIIVNSMPSVHIGLDHCLWSIHVRNF